MTALHKDRARAIAAAETLKLFAQPQRLMILSYLLAGERTVSEINAATSIGQPALSQQLAALRGKALVRTRRHGTQIFYALADETATPWIRCFEAMFGAGTTPFAAIQATASPGPAQAAAPRPAGAAAFVQMLGKNY